jgi:hypothetical protein
VPGIIAPRWVPTTRPACAAAAQRRHRGRPVTEILLKESERSRFPRDASEEADQNAADLSRSETWTRDYHKFIPASPSPRHDADDVSQQTAEQGFSSAT